ncbi:MAG: hypothetical protein E6I93_20170, partial [Chloroflexi bacterium]
MGNLILNSLEIRNFRGFQHLKIERLGRVNLIVGKNDEHAIAILATFPQEHLRIVQSSFVDFAFETYDLINAHYALPFVAKSRFYEVVARVKQALQPGGIFVGQFFGIHDEWNTPGREMTFLTREEAEEALQGLEIVEFREEDVDSH